MSDRPAFKFTGLSWGNTKLGAKAQGMIKRATADGDVELLGEAFELLQRYMALVVTDVPRAWLAADAPDVLDWSDPASFDHVLSERMTDLLRAMTEAQAPAAISPN